MAEICLITLQMGQVGHNDLLETAAISSTHLCIVGSITFEVK